MYDRRMINRSRQIKDWCKNFILYFDQVERRQGGFFIDSGDNRHFITHVTYNRVQDQSVIRWKSAIWRQNYPSAMS